jgi:hypothetical protein
VPVAEERRGRWVGTAARGVGWVVVRLLALVLLLAVVLGAIWLAGSYISGRSPHAAEMTLIDAKVAAITWSEGDPGRPAGFAGFDPETAATIEPLAWNTSPTAVAGEVSIRDVTRTSVVLVTMGPTGPRCIALTMSEKGPPIAAHGVTDARTVAECTDTGW